MWWKIVWEERTAGIEWRNSHRIVVAASRRCESISGFAEPAGDSKADKDQPWMFVQTARGRILNCCWPGEAARCARSTNSCRSFTTNYADWRVDTWPASVRTTRCRLLRSSTRLYIRLIDLKHIRWQDRTHFFAMAARLMRRILVDFARARRNEKRGGGALRMSLDEELILARERGRDLVALDDALVALEPFTRNDDGVDRLSLAPVSRHRVAVVEVLIGLGDPSTIFEVEPSMVVHL